LQCVEVHGSLWAGSGFFYTRFPAPQTGRELFFEKRIAESLLSIALANFAGQDEVDLLRQAAPQRALFRRSAPPTMKSSPYFAVEGTRTKRQDRNAFSIVISQERKRECARERECVPEVRDINIALVDNLNEKFLVLTNWESAQETSLLFDPALTSSRWKVVIPEKTNSIERPAQRAGKLFANY